jgi:RNA-binding protein NOB1
MASQSSEVEGTSTVGNPVKPIHAIILDAGPIIKGVPAVSTLLSQCEQIVTTTSVIEEIKDKATRTRLESLLMPFLILRSPKISSIKLVSEFARKTGDFPVLSQADIELLALAYELECEKNGGDWRLRKSPGQKRTNGPCPFKAVGPNPTKEQPAQEASEESVQRGLDEVDQPANSPPSPVSQEQESVSERSQDNGIKFPDTEEDTPLDIVLTDLDRNPTSITNETEQGEEPDSDSDGWITPSNIKRKQLEGSASNSSKGTEPKTMQVVLCPG